VDNSTVNACNGDSYVTMRSRLFTFERETASYNPYKGNKLVKTLRHNSLASSDVAPKILVVETSFLFNTQFNFPLSSLLVLKSHKCTRRLLMIVYPVARFRAPWFRLPVRLCF
jgi:hypothetical protein